MKFIIATRTLSVVFAILFGVCNNVVAEQVSVDTDENLMLKICSLKFCANVNHIVSRDE